jgi:hypothetical protein
MHLPHPLSQRGAAPTSKNTVIFSLCTSSESPNVAHPCIWTSRHPLKVAGTASATHNALCAAGFVRNNRPTDQSVVCESLRTTAPLLGQVGGRTRRAVAKDVSVCEGSARGVDDVQCAVRGTRAERGRAQTAISDYLPPPRPATWPIESVIIVTRLGWS